MTEFKVGDIVHNIALLSVNTPNSGGFPWSMESKATVVAIYPEGTTWAHMENTGPDTIMIQYEPTTQWGSSWSMTDAIYPAKAWHLQLVEESDA
jgi:hypothetical protein